MRTVAQITLTGWGKQQPAEYLVEANLDVDRILKTLGEKALRNKSRKTRALAGLIRVNVLKVADET